MPADKRKPSFKKSHAESSSIKVQKKDLPDGHKPQALQYRSADNLPGVNKIKASIRQTKRLLTKEGIEPGLKIQTERRLASLQADLLKAEKRELESKNGARYHKIKFFERQKMTRIIKRIQRQIDQHDASNTKGKGKSKELDHDLLRARIMLNYIIHFPNSEKYISLFSSSTDAAEKEQLELPPYLGPLDKEGDSPSKTEKRRKEILNQVREAMEAGQMSAEPEKDKGTRDVKIDKAGHLKDSGIGGQEASGKSLQGATKDRRRKVAEASAEEDQADDFFES